MPIQHMFGKKIVSVFIMRNKIKFNLKIFTKNNPLKIFFKVNKKFYAFFKIF